MTNPELIVEDGYGSDECYVITCHDDNIIAMTSDYDLAQHISDFLVKQRGCSCVAGYRNVDVTHFIAAKDTTLAHDVEVFVNEFRSSQHRLERNVLHEARQTF